MLRAGEGLRELLLDGIAIGDVSPSFNRLLIDCHDVAERENSFDQVLGAHVGAPTHEPITLAQPVDLEGLVETLN